MRKYLVSLAESPARRPDDEVSSIAKIIADAGEDEQLHKTFLETVLQLTCEQPLKIPFVAAVVLAVNTNNAALVKELLGQVSKELKHGLQHGDWTNVKLVLRLLGSLQPILSDEGVFPVLDDLFARAADLQTASAEDALGLELVKIILLTLAYTMKSCGATKHDQAISLLEKTDIIAAAPHNLNSLVSPTVTRDGENGPQCRSVIAMLQQQLQQESANSWPLKCLPTLGRPSDLGELHTLPVVEVPVAPVATIIPKLPELYFSVYAEQEIETVPHQDSIASSLIRDAVVDAINMLDFNRNATAKIIVDIDCYFAEGTFVKRATPFDKLKDVEAGLSTWKPEDVAIDAVFSQLVMLPTPAHKVVYYHALLTEACKIAPAAIAPSLGRAIRFMYKNIENIDLEVAIRFTDWFAHHLSNFGFTWKWTEWIGDLELPSTHPRKAFILGTLDKEIRLSFAQRIRGTLPEQYLPLIPESKDKDIPDFKFSGEDMPYAQHAKEILRLIRSKAPDTDVQEHIAAVEKEAVDRIATDPVLVSADVFVTSVCFAGAKSLSHVLNIIQRCRERLLSIATHSETARRQIIDSVMEYWREKPGVGVNIVDKLLNYTILTPMSVIEWAVVSRLRRGELLAQHHVFELVAGTINKVARRIRQIVAGRRQNNLTEQQTESLNAAFDAENGQMKQLFTVLEDSLRGIAEASNDETIERTEEDGADEALLRGWGRRWLKAFTRKLAVEQAWVTETLAMSLPEPETPAAEDPVDKDAPAGAADAESMNIESAE